MPAHPKMSGKKPALPWRTIKISGKIGEDEQSIEKHKKDNKFIADINTNYGGRSCSVQCKRSIPDSGRDELDD